MTERRPRYFAAMRRITLIYLENVSFGFLSLRHTPKFAGLRVAPLHYDQRILFAYTLPPPPPRDELQSNFYL
jgi:hypothetical protein